MMKKKIRQIVIGITFLFCGISTGCGKGSAEENIQAGMQQIQNHQYEEAMASFETAVAENENPRLIARGRGIASLGMTNYEDAITYLTEALGYSRFIVDETDYDINYYLADAYTKSGDLAKASEIYTNILALRPKEADALFLRGKNSLLLGNYESAVADFEDALSINKDEYELRIEIAGVLSQTGYREEGQKYLSEFLAENEKKLSDYDKGRISYYLGDFESAKVYLEKAKTDDSENTILLLGKSYEQLGDFNYATSVYKNYLTQHEDAALIYNQLGLCKLQSGEYGEALLAFNSAAAVENSGMEQTIAFNQIVAYEYQGDFRQAAVLMKTYLQKYPDDEDAVREYEFLISR